MLDAIDHNFGFARFDAEELVVALMHLFPNLFAGLQRHQHELQVLPGVKDPAVVLVRYGEPIDVVDKSLLETGWRTGLRQGARRNRLQEP
ncbi:hypothetical protein D3C87_1881110 [compost metagenome]